MDHDKEVVTSWVSIFLLISLLCNIVFLWRNVFETIDSSVTLVSFNTGHPGASEEAVNEPINDIIVRIAKEYKYSSDTLINLAWCESRMDPSAVGGDAGCFHGLYQWNTCATNIVSLECANDPECATAATIQALQRGEQWRWPNCQTE